MDTSPPPQTGETDSKPATRDFKSLFCEHYHCPPSEFEERAFRACLYWRARILAPVIRRIWPGYFATDTALIGYLAKTPGRRDAINELAAFMESNDSRGGFARKFLRIRISSHKAGRLIGLLFERRPRRDEPEAASRAANGL